MANFHILLRTQRRLTRTGTARLGRGAPMSMRLSDIRMRDPFILKVPSGGFVLFGTTDANLWGGPATGFDCFTSKDLEMWEGPIPAFRPPAGFWADTVLGARGD